MRKILLTVVVVMLSMTAWAQSLPCPAPTPGVPHVCLTWVASTTSGVTYNVYRSTTAGGENFSTPLNISPISVVFFYDTTVAIGTTYFYKVVAVGTGGVLSLPTAEVQAQIPVPPSSPTTPAAVID
jgi:fibronectin type 3 domain-containing protein